MAEPNANNLIVGPAVVYIKSYLITGTVFPSLTAKPAAADWATATWIPLGYTEDGVALTLTPSKKDFVPDEAITPAKTIVTGVSGELKVTLWEATAENMSRAIALAAINNPGAGLKTVSVGSGNPLLEWSLGIQGAGVGGVDARVISIFRANVVSAVENKMTRKDITKLACTFNLLTDSSKASTGDVCTIIDFNAGS